MKKYLILTSVLALAACGGGHHGGGAGGIAPLSTEQSNARVTGMATYLHTDDMGNTLDSRAAGIRQAGQYDLSNVNFLLTDEGFGGGMVFTVDADKKIDGIKLVADEDDPDDRDIVFERNSDTNEFYDNIGQINTGGSSYKKGKLVYNSLGMDGKVGLRYSDFGNANVYVYDDESGDYKPVQTVVFIGGYDNAKIIREDDIENIMHFTGKSTGSVTAIRYGQDSGDDYTIVLNGDANLDFDPSNKQTTLNTDFDNWYKVKYVKNNSEEYVTFNDYKNEKSEYKLVSDNGVNDVRIDAPTDNTTAKLNTEIRYYGDGNNPTEAVGMIQVRDKGVYTGAPEDSPYNHMEDYETENGNPVPEVRMNLSFGVKKD